MMTYKQKEVLEQAISKVQRQFPEVRLINVSEMNANSFWIRLTEPRDEDEELKMVELLGKLATDALMDYGFDFQFVPTNGVKAAA